MSTILTLPYDMYNIILSDSCLDIKDLISFKNTCRYLHYVCSTCVHDTVWRKHFFKKWPRLKRTYENLRCKRFKFYDHTILSLKCRKQLNDHVALMYKKYIDLLKRNSLYSKNHSLMIAHLTAFHYGADILNKKNIIYHLSNHFSVYIIYRNFGDEGMYEIQNAHFMNYYFILDEFVTRFEKLHLDKVRHNGLFCNWCLHRVDDKLCSVFMRMLQINFPKHTDFNYVLECYELIKEHLRQVIEDFREWRLIYMANVE